MQCNAKRRGTAPCMPRSSEDKDMQCNAAQGSAKYAGRYNAMQCGARPRHECQAMGTIQAKKTIQTESVSKQSKTRTKNHPQHTHGAQRRLRQPRNTGCGRHPGLENVKCGMWGSKQGNKAREARQPKDPPKEYRTHEHCKRKKRPQAESKRPVKNMDTQ